MTEETHSNKTPNTAESMHYVADVNDIESGKRIIVEVDGREIAIFNDHGEYHALLNYCVHQGGPVCEGVVNGKLEAGEDGSLVYNETSKTVACPWHGWKFDINSGRHTARSGYRIPSYSVVVRDDQLFLE